MSTDTTVAARLDPKEYFWIQDLADRLNLSKSQVLRIVIARARTGQEMPEGWAATHG